MTQRAPRPDSPSVSSPGVSPGSLLWLAPGARCLEPMPQRLKAAAQAHTIIYIIGAVALLSLGAAFVLSVTGRDGGQFLSVTGTASAILAAFLQPGAAARRATDAEPAQRVTGGGYDNGGDR